MLAATAAPSRLMATNPLPPRAKAIALPPLSHQWSIGMPATTRRKPTMAAISGSRCSHTQVAIVAGSRLGAHHNGPGPPPPGGGPASLPPCVWRLHAYLDIPLGWPYGWGIMHALPT